MPLNRRCLDDLATNALERETLTREDLDEIFDAHDLRRNLIPKDSESEARKLIARARARSTGALRPQHTRGEKPGGRTCRPACSPRPRDPLLSPPCWHD